MFENDPETKAILMIGEIGGDAESRRQNGSSTIVQSLFAAFIAGRTAPPGRRMGHAGAIISNGQGTAQGKIDALRAAGAFIAESPAEMGLALLQTGLFDSMVKP